MAAVDVLIQVELEWVRYASARSLPTSVGESLSGGSAGEALHDVKSPAYVSGDIPQPVALDEQVMHDRAVPPSALGELTAGLRLHRMRRLH